MSVPAMLGVCDADADVVEEAGEEVGFGGDGGGRPCGSSGFASRCLWGARDCG